MESYAQKLRQQKEQMMRNSYEGDGTEGRTTFGSGFHAWRKRQAEKAPTADAIYERYVAWVTGANAQDAAGVVRPEAPGMGAVVLSEAADMDDDGAYKICIGNPTAATRRSGRRKTSVRSAVTALRSTGATGGNGPIR